MFFPLTEDEKATGSLDEERLAAAVRIFRDMGIVVVANAYDTEFLAEVRTEYDKVLEEYLEARGGLDALDGKTFGKNHIGFFPSLFLPIGDARIAAPPIGVQIMEQVLGKDLHCSFYHTNTACPGSGIQPVHRDTGLLFGSDFPVATPTYSLVLNVPLCDFTEENGSTEYWPGSHLMVDHHAEDSKLAIERSSHLPSVRLNMPFGSFALRDLRAWHRGMPNNADYSRTMFALVFHRSFMSAKPVTIPRTTWDSWSDAAKHIYRRNQVVEDDQHNALTWEELRG